VRVAGVPSPLKLALVLLLVAGGWQGRIGWMGAFPSRRARL